MIGFTPPKFSTARRTPFW